MDQHESLGRLNSLAKAWAGSSVPFETTEQIREFARNPGKYARGLDSPLKEAIDEMVDLFPTLSTSDRSSVSSSLNRSAQNALLRFAMSRSVLAGRLASPALVSRGLVALAVEGGRLDIRDSIGALHQLHDSANALGIECPSNIFGCCRISPQG